jgi:hypothetical protein
LLLQGAAWSDSLRFRLERADYLAALDAARTAGASTPIGRRGWIDIGPPTVAFFVWRGFLSAVHGVVYDETGDISKPPDARTPQWNNRFAATDLGCPSDVRPLEGHFYAIHLAC